MSSTSPDDSTAVGTTVAPAEKLREQAYAAWLADHRLSVDRARAAQAAVESRWSLARLGVFVLTIAVWYFASGSLWLGLLAILGGVAVFIACVRIHQRQHARLRALDRELLMIDESTRRAGGEVVLIRSRERPPDEARSGAAVAADLAGAWPLTEQERDDLDLYSPPVGLFGLLNRTSTEGGARRLRDVLENPLINAAQLAERQAAVRWLAQQHTARLGLMAAASSLRPEQRTLRLLTAALENAARPLTLAIGLSFLRVFGVVSGVAALLMLAPVAVGQFGWGLPLVALLTVNGVLFYRVRAPVRAALDAWQNVQAPLRGLAGCADVATRELPADGVLGAIRTRLAAAGRADVLPALAARSGFTEHGGAVHELFNIVCLFDVHIAGALLHVAVPARAAVLDALGALAELEALTSLAAFAAEQPIACWPEFAPGAGVTIECGQHVFLPPDAAVANTLSLSRDSRVWVVTGSNMAGKSTFLRMCAVNVLLAQVGTAAIAARMRLEPLRLMSDLRVRDNLTRAESYFLAEVRHLRRMVVPPSGPAPIFGLIDEPLRGTNSAEQVAASLAVLEHLIACGDFFIVATHDHKLTELAAKSPFARNFHFEENLTESGMSFDYRLREGPARTRNALRVLEREGFPLALMSSARRWLAETDAAAAHAAHAAR